MTLFKTIPVFTWPIDWSNSVNGQWAFDLRELQIGFGVELIDPLQTDIIRGWEFQVTVREDDILDIDAFLDGLKGRALPFWMPGPAASFKIVAAGISASSFKVLEQGDATGWTLSPDSFVCFSSLGATDQYAQIQSITENGDGTETVILTSPLGTAVDSDWQIFPLMLVRMADDAEQVEVVAERYQIRYFKVVELPRDYQDVIGDGFAASPPAAPVWLYTFTAAFPDSTTYWRFTSNPVDVTAAGDTWIAGAIEHDSMSRTAQLGGTVNISGDFDTIEPLRLCIPARLSVPLRLEIARLIGGIVMVVFNGLVRKPSMAGKRVKATVIEFGDIMEASFPSFFIQSDCNYHVYDPATCRADRASKQVTVNIIDQLGDDMRSITIQGAGLVGALPGWFAGGWIEVGTGKDRVVLFVLQNNGADGNKVSLQINNPVILDIPRGGIAFPGCDGQRTTCMTKFFPTGEASPHFTDDKPGNLINFGGHNIPLTNLTLSAIQTNPSTGGKK